VSDDLDSSGRSSQDDRARFSAWRLLRDPAALLVVILMTAALVRFIGIWRPSFSTDEISELRVAHTGIAEIVTFDDGNPPLYNLLLHAVVPLGDLAGRVLSALFGVATVGVVWAWARRAVGSRAGTYAAWLVALSPMAVQLSQEGRAYALVVLLAALSMWSLWVALDEPSSLRWARWGLISALGIYTHYLFAILVAAWLLVALIEVRGRPSRQMWIGIGSLGLVVAPVLALLPGDLSLQASLGSRVAPSEVLYAGYRLFAGLSLGPSLRDLFSLGILEAIKATWMWIALLAVPVGLLSIEGWRGLTQGARRRLLALSLLGLLLQLLVLQVGGMGFGPSYVTWLLIPLAVWFAAGLARLRPWSRRASAALLVGVATCSLVAFALDPHHQIDDSRGVAAYLKSSGALDYPILVSGDDRARPIAYYLDPSSALAVPDHWDPEEGRLGDYRDEQIDLISIPRLESEGFTLADALQVVDASAAVGQTYYLVYTQVFYADPHGELLSTLRSRDGLTLTAAFPGMDVYRGTRSS
jgi:mannosyltransferase